MKVISYSKSLHRALSVLKCFTPQETDISGAEIARRVGIHRTTAYRLLAAMTEEGIIERDKNTGKYEIGPTLYVLGSLYLRTTNIVKAADPVIKKLNELTGEAVSVGILNRDNVTIIMKEETRGIFRFSTHIGTNLPAYASAFGRALLSELSETELDNLYHEEELPQITKKTITTKKRLKLELEQVRKTGISIDDEGCYEGAVAIASLIRNSSGKTVAAMNFAVPALSINQAKLELLAKFIRLGASLVSYRLGYQDPVNPIRDIQELDLWWKQNQLHSASE